MPIRTGRQEERKAGEERRKERIPYLPYYTQGALFPNIFLHLLCIGIFLLSCSAYSCYATITASTVR
jgi:hypothetical protein